MGDANELLTLGVPTFNRKSSVLTLVLMARGSLPVVVIDDGSTDGTQDALQACPGVTYVRHKSNLGYAFAFLRLFEECQTEYLMVAADDDHLNLGVLDSLTEMLAGVKPDFVATQYFMRDGYRARGRDTSQKILDRDFLSASSHAPGIVYRLSATQSALRRLRDALEAENEAAHTYPQVLLLAVLLARKADCRWWPGAPVIQGVDDNPSGITSKTGGSYRDYAARLRQHAGFSNFFAGLDGAEGLVTANQDKLLSRVRYQLTKSQRIELDVAYERRLRRKRQKLQQTLFRPLADYVWRICGSISRKRTYVRFVRFR